MPVEFSDAVIILTVISAAGAIVAILLALMALAGQRRVQRAYRVFSRGSQEDVLELLKRHIAEVESLRADVAEMQEMFAGHREMIANAVSHVATLRYDAFADMGGHMSYSTAMLDEHGNGVVLTSIHGRSDTRTYAKPVEAGQSAHTLSEEELAVIQTALAKKPGAPVAQRAS